MLKLMRTKLKQLQKDQNGIASIIIVVVIILILTLVVLAMSRNANREQRQALDRQLSSAAFYAAESGINDTINYVRGNLTTAPKEKTQCDVSGDNRFQDFPDGKLSDDADGLIQYSCVLYDLDPKTIQVTVDDSSTIIPIQNSQGSGVSSLTLEWEQEDSPIDFTGCPDGANTTIPGSWFSNCDAGMLRIEIIDPNKLSRQDLVDNNFTAFVFPTRPGSTNNSIIFPNGKDANQGVFGYGNCDPNASGAKCSIRIDSIGLNDDSRLFIRVRSLYKPSNLIISGQNNVVGRDSVEFLNAQVMIDSTGKANDVLRRLQVRVPVTPKYDIPSFAIQTTDDLCKLIDIYPAKAQDADSCNY